MSRLVVYGRSSFCPDMMRWDRWVKQHPIAYVSYDIDADQGARDFVLRWTGHLSVPTLVIAPEEHDGPAEEPSALPGRGPRAVDRGSMLTEPGTGQVEEFLRRNGIPFGGPGGAPEVTDWAITPKGEQRKSWFSRG
ncbi:MAG: glutaredoxin family protein [Dehalococcoidia bacterium]